MSPVGTQVQHAMAICAQLQCEQAFVRFACALCDHHRSFVSRMRARACVICCCCLLFAVCCTQLAPNDYARVPAARARVRTDIDGVVVVVVVLHTSSVNAISVCLCYRG